MSVHTECDRYVYIGDAAEFDPMITAIRRAGAAGKPLQVLADELTIARLRDIQALAEGCGLDAKWRLSLHSPRADLHLLIGSPERRRAVR